MDQEKIDEAFRALRGTLDNRESFTDEEREKYHKALDVIEEAMPEEPTQEPGWATPADDSASRVERLLIAGSPLLAAYLQQSQVPRVDIPATVIVRLLALLEQIVLGRKLGPDEVLYAPARTGEGTDAPAPPADPDKPSN